MKKSKLWFTGTAVLVPAAILAIVFGISRESTRESYEKFLLLSARTIPADYKEAPKDKEGEAGQDSPDMAAYSEFVKTVDPALKAVPAARLREAWDYTHDLQSLKSTGGNLAWTAHPTDMGGRTRVLFADPNDPAGRRVFAGSVTGGLWTSDDPWNGMDWQPVNDFWANLSVSAMVSDPDNPQVIYLGTGESQTALYIYRESSTRGIGMMKSTDGGQTWVLMPSTSDWAYITDLVIRKENGINVLYAGVVSGLYKGTLHESLPSDGLYRSTDGGVSWTQVLPLIPGTSRPYLPSDIELSADGAKIFVGTTYRGNDRTGAACILSSTDGINWNVMDTYYNRLIVQEVWDRNGIPYQYPGRVMLAKAPSNPSILYAGVAGGYIRGDQFVGYDCRFILKTTDKGATWTELPHPDVNYTSAANLAWHALALGVDPTDANIVWIGGLDVCRSMDGGQTWEQLSYWAPGTAEQQTHYVHADIHAFLFNPLNPAEMLIGTDGGVFSTSQPKEDSPVFVERNQNYSTLQFYSCAIHPDAGTEVFTGGLQDNGTLLYIGPGRPTVNNRIGGGDGAYCFIDQNEPDIHLFTIYYTWIYYASITPTQGRLYGAFNYNVGTFINPMDYDYQYNVLYANGCHFTGFNANKLRVIRLVGNQLTPIPNSPMMDIPTNSPVPYSSIKWFENSGMDASTIYIGTEAGRIFRLTDAMIGGELTDLTKPELPAAYISSIDLGFTEDTVLLTFSNYGVPSVWVSSDAGQSWTNVEANLPDMPVRWGIFHPKSGKQVMLATETGIWTTDNVFAQNVVWKPDVAGMANVRVDMLKFRKSDNTVLAATHGRGMFTTTWEPNYTSGMVEVAEEVEKVEVYPNPTDGRFEVYFRLKGDARLSVSDMTGRRISDETIAGMDGNFGRSFDLTNYSKGIYLVKVVTTGKTTTRQVLVK